MTDAMQSFKKLLQKDDGTLPSYRAAAAGSLAGMTECSVNTPFEVSYEQKKLNKKIVFLTGPSVETRSRLLGGRFLCEDEKVVQAIQPLTQEQPKTHLIKCKGMVARPQNHGRVERHWQETAAVGHFLHTLQSAGRRKSEDKTTMRTACGVVDGVGREEGTNYNTVVNGTTSSSCANTTHACSFVDQFVNDVQDG